MPHKEHIIVYDVAMTIIKNFLSCYHSTCYLFLLLEGMKNLDCNKFVYYIDSKTPFHTMVLVDKYRDGCSLRNVIL